MVPFREGEAVNPLGKEVEELLATETEPMITPPQLLEIVTEGLAKTLPGTLRGAAKQRVLSFLIDPEYRYDIRKHIALAIKARASGRWPDANPTDNSDRIDGLVAEHKNYAGDAGTEDEPLAEIDSPVMTGNLTRLHVAASDNEYDEVVRLVEKCGARLDVVDNSGFVPAKRARFFGHHLIAEYLEKKAAVR